MNKRVISAIVSAVMTASMLGGFASVASAAEAKTPKYQEKARQMEDLNRGLIAVKTTADTRDQTVDGVYLSWRLLGTESLTNQAFDIYKNGKKIHTTGAHDATNWIDTAGSETDTYKVVKAGEDASSEPETTPTTISTYAKPSEVGNGNSLKHSYTYMDVPIERPADSNGGHYYTTSSTVQGGANDASVGDLDGDGDYEIVLKWDPDNSKDAAAGGTTGHTYIDGYEISENPGNGEHLYMWRIDLGPHVRSGAHENPFLVYDFDGDGKAEIASLSGPGTIDGTGHYVTEVGDTEEIRNADNTLIQLNKGKNIGPEYYTLFDGETGKALWTTNAIPIGSTDGKNWGKNLLNESQRYLAAVAYLDGVHPSIVMCRGYYYRAALRAYTWDGSEMTMQWEYDCGQSGIRDDSLYRQGNHNLSVGDIDNDGKDEIVYGSAALDDDGKTVLGNTKLGHGDAMHMSDFNNDGKQEVMSVKEHYMKMCAENFRDALTGKSLHTRTLTVGTDNGRGVMDNIDDAYALAQHNAGNDAALALSWSSGFDNIHDMNGNDLKAKPNGGSRGFDNSLVYWDGDLGRELLDDNLIGKYDAENGWTKRFYGPNDGYTLTGGTTNNYSKRNASLSADLWGDWREEIILPTGKGQNEEPALRIYTSTVPTEYRLTTLMHDCQYRLGIAWQNVAYNQPPHTSYYIGSVALATDESGNTLNYLAPEVPYTKVTYEAPAQVDVTGVEIKNKDLTIEKGKTATVNAVVSPEDASKKGITWSSSDESIATVSNGIVKGVGVGTATITATTKDGGFTDTCEVTVFSTPVTGVSLSEKLVELGIGNTAALKANVFPADATDTSVTWTSDDPAVASVSDKGVITGLSFGKTTITATAGGKTAKCIVKVKPMSIVDATGDDVFVSTNTDAETKLEGASATGGTLNQKAASVGGEFHKDFQVYDNNTATLTFRVTTGGQKDDSGAWKWAGREYALNMALLDSEGNNIITVAQPYGSGGAGNMTSKVRDEAAAIFDDDWSGSKGDIQGSTKRWIVTFEFDYENDICNARIVGTDGTWETVNGDKTKTFSLNGANFKTLKFYTEPNNGGLITATPKLEMLNYTSTTQVSGNTDVLYEKGTKDTAWQETDLADWTQAGSDTAALALDSENGRIWYNPTQPAAEYSATKTISGIADDGIVSYDVDWYFGSATGRTSVLEYIQIGSALRIGWTSGYVTWVSTDGGATWNDNDSDGTADSIFTGANESYTKNVKVIFDKKSNTIRSLVFDGKTIDAYTNYALPDGAKIDSVSFGLQRGGGTSNWAYPNGIDRIRVAQFIEGEEEPDFSTVKITGTSGKEANVAYELVDYYGGSMKLIGALYDSDNKLVEVTQTDDITFDDSLLHIRRGTADLTFTNDVDNYKLKVFAWDSLDGMTPVCDSAEKKYTD